MAAGRASDGVDIESAENPASTTGLHCLEGIKCKT